MQKYLLCLLPIGFIHAGLLQWQDFENNVYVGSAISVNDVTVSKFGTTSNASGLINLGATNLFDNHIYLKLDAGFDFNNGGSFVSNWSNADFKVGYSIQSDEINLIPYGVMGIGNDGAYYSNVTNYKYGLGLLTEYMITPDWLLYADINYQLQNFSGDINNNFNQNVLNNTATYHMDNNNPSTYGIDIGIKYITKNGLYFNPYFKYQDYQQSFSLTGGLINYGTLTPTTNQYQIGINVGLSI